MRDDFHEGDSFNHEVQSRRREEEMEERERRRQEAAERREHKTREMEEAQTGRERERAALETNSPERVAESSEQPRLLSDLVRLVNDGEEEGEELDSNEEGQVRDLHEDKSATYEVNTENSSDDDERPSRRRHDSDSD